MNNGAARSDPFSGDSLLELLVRPLQDPVQAGLPTLGNFVLLIAAAFVGKTSLMLWLAMSRARGVAPWDGAPTPIAGPVLIIAPDESAEQLVRRADGLSRVHPAGRLDLYAENLHVLAPDPQLDDRALEALRFDEVGLGRLAARLQQAHDAGRPFLEVFVDAYSDVLPPGVSENDNAEGARIGGALQRLAVKFGCAITVLHHSGKPPKDAPADLDVTFQSRGASSLAAKARLVFALETVPEMPWCRQIRTKTNLGPTPRTALFEVSPEGSEGALTYFKPVAAPQPQQLHPRDFLLDGQSITTTALAELLEQRGAGGRRVSGGDAKNLAARLRRDWFKAGLILVEDGPRGAKMITLRDDPTEASHA
jgi:hypothetical protein